MICTIYMPLHEFIDYYTEKVGEIFRNANFIPLVAYIDDRNGYIYFYFLKDAKPEINIKEVLDDLNMSLKKNDAYITPPIIELLKDRLFTKKDLKLLDRQILNFYMKGTIRVVANNIKGIILKDKPIFDYYWFLDLIFRME